MEDGTPQDREKALGNLLLLLTKLMTARASAKRADIEKSKIELQRKRFEDLRTKAEKATNEAAVKLGKGKGLTLADINNIRERTFGLPPIQRGASAGH
jgi:hypothetical protein